MRTCILDGCNKPRAISTNGANYLACCREHYLKYRADQQKTPGTETTTTPAATGAASGAGAARKCHLCEGQHTVQMCPKLNDARRKELADTVQMTNDPIWWSNADNRKKAQDYAKAHQWAMRTSTADALQREADRAKSNSADANHHGWAILVGSTRKVYFDLGGEFNLADDSLYDLVEDAHRHGNMTIRLVTAAELGHPGGVPIDMAAGATGSSSIIRVQKWAVVNIEVSTLQGRRLHLTQQTVGFVSRSTPLLLLGQQACKLCGYRTIEEQDKERSQQQPSQIVERVGLSVTEFERQPMGLTCAPCTFHRWQDTTVNPDERACRLRTHRDGLRPTTK